MKPIVAYLLFLIFFPQSSLALPPPEDTPEEVLRTEIILDGRSPINGRSLTASEYAKLQEQITESDFRSPISPKIRELIFLLRLRKLFRTVTPF